MTVAKLDATLGLVLLVPVVLSVAALVAAVARVLPAGAEHATAEAGPPGTDDPGGAGGGPSRRCGGHGTLSGADTVAVAAVVNLAHQVGVEVAVDGVRD